MRLVIGLALLSAALALDAGLYGVAFPPQPVRVDPRTAAMTALGPIVPDESTAQELSTIDEKAQVLYIIGWNFTAQRPNLLGFSLNSGLAVTNIELPLVGGGLVGMGQTVDVDPVTGDVFVTGHAETGGPHVLLRVVPRTGKVSFVGNIGNYFETVGASSVYETFTNTLWLPYGVNTSGVVNIDLFGVNVRTAEMRHVVTDTYAGKMISTFNIDQQTRRIVGLGIKLLDGVWVRVLNSFEPKTGTFEEIAVIKDYLHSYGAETALNQKDRILYAYLSPNDEAAQRSVRERIAAGISPALAAKEGAAEGRKFSLVSISLDTGAVLSSVHACVMGQMPRTCAWALEYFNG